MDEVEVGTAIVMLMFTSNSNGPGNGIFAIFKALESSVDIFFSAEQGKDLLAAYPWIEVEMQKDYTALIRAGTFPASSPIPPPIHFAGLEAYIIAYALNDMIEESSGVVLPYGECWRFEIKSKTGHASNIFTVGDGETHLYVYYSQASANEILDRHAVCIGTEKQTRIKEKIRHEALPPTSERPYIHLCGPEADVIGAALRAIFNVTPPTSGLDLSSLIGDIEIPPFDPKKAN